MNRRDFLIRAGAAGFAAGSLPLFGQNAAPSSGKLRVMCVGVIGTIGGTDRKQIASHPDTEITVLCDVDSHTLAAAAKDHPNAVTCRDFREAFVKHADKFDAVVVSTPDHTHALILLTALAHHKHVYGQKPLVHELEELAMVDKAVAARPKCVTQLGNQRMANAGRRAAVEILRRGTLGKVREAHIWVGSPLERSYFNVDREMPEPSEAPANLDWDLWLGPAGKVPYRSGIAPVKWRSWWEYGSNGLGDWGCHVLDVVFLAFPELGGQIKVRTDCELSPNPHFHANPCRSIITYKVSSPRFVGGTFPIHFNDSNQAPTRESIGLPPGNYPDTNMTCVVCEGGTLLLTANGRLEIWRDGKVESGLKMPDLPDFPKMNHWHSWVDACLGRPAEVLTPFPQAIRITECVLLAVKAARFPNTDLIWDRKKLAFTNHAEATATVVRRKYRGGFVPPVVA